MPLNTQCSLSIRFHFCSGVSRDADNGARSLLAVLRSIGGKILEVPGGEIHPNPESDIEDDGCIIVRPGMAHALLERESSERSRLALPSCSFGYIHDSRSADFSQSVNTNRPDSVDAAARGQLALARLLYKDLAPKYGWIDEPGENEPSTGSIRMNVLKHLFWANFFGPAYVEEYGRKFFMQAPGWKHEELDDGGILYVASESYVEWRSSTYKKVLDHFKLKIPAIRAYRSAGFDRTEARLASLPKKKRRKPRNDT